MDRRHFLSVGTAGALGMAAWRGIRAQGVSGSTSVGVPTLVGGSIAVNSSVTLPAPQQSGIEHIVVVTMENRSFDHLMGWFPGADGQQTRVFVDQSGIAHNTYSLAPALPDYTGCPHPDPDHSYDQSRVAYDNGAMDGFLRAGKNDVYTIGYYGQTAIPFYAALAQNYMLCDRAFASILGPTFSNRMFIWSAQTDRLGDTVSFTSLPTIFERLAAAGVSHRYYFNNIPYLALWGLKYITSMGLFSDFLAHAAAGTLPAVSFVDPKFTVLDDGTGNDDHPHADIRNGDAFLSQIYRALTANAAWKNTVLIITFDEWGGFFEHVAPPRAAAPNNVDTDLVNGQALLGFRIPVVVVSPFTKNAGVSHTVFDHTSALKLIEWRWNLQPLTSRDASAQIGNFATSMNFQSPDASVPVLPQVSPVAAAPCFENIVSTLERPRTGAATETAAQGQSPWAALAQSEGVRQWREAGKLPGPSRR